MITRKQQTLRVVPNPYCHLDEDGEPAGACPADPAHAGGARRWVGAVLDTERTKLLDRDSEGRKIRRPKWDTTGTDQITKFKFSADVVELPQSVYYLDRIRDGELIAADEETSRKAFGAGSKYVPAKEALAKHRGLAVERHEAAYGEKPAFVAAPEHKHAAKVGGE